MHADNKAIGEFPVKQKERNGKTTPEKGEGSHNGGRKKGGDSNLKRQVTLGLYSRKEAFKGSLLRGWRRQMRRKKHKKCFPKKKGG